MIENLQKIVVTDAVERKLNTIRQNDDEIDLAQLVVKLSTLVRRHSNLIIISLCLGALGGLIAFLIVKPRFKSELVISVPSLQQHELQRLLVYCQQEIQLTDKAAKIEMVDNVTEDRHSFIISATTSDPKNYPSLRAYLVQHINNNAFVKQEKEIREQQLKQTITLLDIEERKVAVALDQTFASKTLFDTDFNVAELEKLKLDMLKERLKLMSELNNLETSSVIQDFVTPIEPYNKNILLFFTFAFIVSAFLCLTAIFIIETKRLTKKMQHVQS